MQKLFATLLTLLLAGWPLPAAVAMVPQDVTNPYYWSVAPVGNSAELLTLFCRHCTGAAETPLVAVLRDTLGDADPENDRLVYVWLLDYSPLEWRQRALAAVPFFYWRVGKGSDRPEDGNIRPLLNVAAPLHPVLSNTNRQLLQWTLFDPMATEVRAATRAYGENERDQERIRLEETISYLSKAPLDGPGAMLSQRDADLLMARLSLRKRLLGGLVANEQARPMGENERLADERERIRNWEYLREATERAGLIFEPLRLSDGSENYALVWYRPGSLPPPPAGSDDGPVWRILRIQNPWKDQRLTQWHGLTVDRDINGETQALIPLAAYSLTYPRMPLLMVDFRSQAHVRHHEVLQRSVNQLVSGVLGLSHFANWYYFAGADAYTFIAGRRGAALNRAARLDSYADFRSSLALDTSLPGDLRKEMQSRLGQLEVNPLSSSPEAEVQTARVHYANLQKQAADGELMRMVSLERRAEVAEFGQGGGHVAVDATLHALSLGTYTHRASDRSDLLIRLDRGRRVEENLAFLDRVVKAGARPEVEFDPQRVAASIDELSELLPGVHSKRVNTRAIADLNRVRAATSDAGLRADCEFALRVANREWPQGIAAKPRAFKAVSTLDKQK